MTHIGELMISFALGGLITGPMAYHSGLTDGARKMLRQLMHEAKR